MTYHKDTEAHYTFALDGYAMTHCDCWLAAFSDVPCDGRMEKAHLVRQQTIKREIRGAEDPKAILWDSRVLRPGCYRHHTMLDQAKTLRIPREAIPVETEQYAAELGLTWWLDRTYLRTDVAA